MKFDIEKLTGYRDEDGEIFVSLTDVQKAISTVNTESDRRMTNAEKLARNIQFMANAVLHYDCSNHKCEKCPLKGEERCERNSSTVEEWLESEAEE